MNPARFSQMMKYLTRAKKANPNLPDVFSASKAPIPAKTKNVEEIEAINRFNRDNPRKNMDNGGSVKFYPKASGSISGKSEIAPGIDVNTRDINYGGTVMYEGDKFYSGVSLDKGKVKFDVTDSDGTTLFKDTLSKDDAVNFIVGLGDPKGEKFQIKTDKDFNNMEVVFRKSFAGGGMLVQPGFGGVRQGYRSDKAIKAAQQAGNVAKIKKRFDRIGKAFIEQDYNALKTLTRPDRIKKGAKDAGGILNASDTVLLNNVILGKDVKAQNALAKKLGVNRRYMIDTYKEALEFTKTGKSQKQSALALKKIITQKKLFDEILKNPNATVKSMAKKFNKTEKQITKEASKLLRNVYDQNVIIGKKDLSEKPLKSWLPDDFNITDDFLDNFSNIKGLKKVQSENIGTLIRDAFGRGQNPKKYVEALQGLSEYNEFRDTLPDNLKIDLDHPLSKAFLKGSNVSPEKLLYVTPISRGYNRGFKESLSKAYDKALLADVKDTKKIKQIENLAKTLNINIGKGSTKKFDFGATNIAKKTQESLREELVQNLREQNLASKNLQKLKKTDEGKKLLKEIFPRGRKLEIPEVDKKILNNIQSYSKLSQCKVGAADGGRIGFAFSDECIRDGLKEQKIAAQNGNKKAARELVQVGKVATRAGLLKNLLGPGAILGEAVYEGAVIGNKVLGGKPADIAWAESYLSYLDPRKYRGELDPLKMEREDMLESTADKNILQKGFDAQDRISAFNEAREKEELAQIRQRPDQLMTEAEREKLRAYEKQSSPFIKDSALQKDADIISSEAFKDASSIAQEYLQGQSGQQQADFGVLSVPQSTMADEGRRVRAMTEMKNLYPQYSDKDILNILKEYNLDPKDYDYTYTPRNFPADTSSKPLTGFDDIRDFYQQDQAMQNIADAGGVANLAGGGIAKMAGVSSGVAPASGPNPQGLLSLKNRVRNY